MEILGDQDAFDDIEILDHVLQPLQFSWPTANLFHALNRGGSVGSQLEPEPPPIDPGKKFAIIYL
jgi:hypothetical protein